MSFYARQRDRQIDRQRDRSTGWEDERERGYENGQIFTGLNQNVQKSKKKKTWKRTKIMILRKKERKK